MLGCCCCFFNAHSYSEQVLSLVWLYVRQYTGRAANSFYRELVGILLSRVDLCIWYHCLGVTVVQKTLAIMYWLRWLVVGGLKPLLGGSPGPRNPPSGILFSAESLEIKGQRNSSLCFPHTNTRLLVTTNNSRTGSSWTLDERSACQKSMRTW